MDYVYVLWIAFSYKREVVDHSVDYQISYYRLPILAHCFVTKYKFSLVQKIRHLFCCSSRKNTVTLPSSEERCMVALRRATYYK